jgi:amidophosphoribosyltransferase
MNHDDAPKDSCGVFGVFNHPQAARLTYYGLYALQHRGQESAGIVVSNGNDLLEKKSMGLVSEIFHEQDFALLEGQMACGHVRYSTAGASVANNAQPLLKHYADRHFCLAHNGNLTNARCLRQQLEARGSIFRSSSDSEVLIHLLVRHLHLGLQNAVIESLRQVEGAYCFIIMTDYQLIAARDPHGFHPLCLGWVDNAYVLASETCALDLINAVYMRDIEPGEVVFIDKNGLSSVKPFARTPPHQCIFELVYFARPDSDIFGLSVYDARRRQGVILAEENPDIKGDFIMPFPDSGNYAAIGLSAASGIPLEMGMIRNHYVGRSFIQPTQHMRNFAVRVKLNPVHELIKGKKVIVVDDSIVRGTTALNRVKGLRSAGAEEVHMMVASPPCRFPCYYGVDFAEPEQLVANTHTLNEIRQMLGLDSLRYISVAGLKQSTGQPDKGYCLACFTGEYPVPCLDRQHCAG